MFTYLFIFVLHLFGACLLRDDLSPRLFRPKTQDGGDDDTAIASTLNG